MPLLPLCELGDKLMGSRLHVFDKRGVGADVLVEPRLYTVPQYVAQSLKQSSKQKKHVSGQFRVHVSSCYICQKGEGVE